MRTVDRIRPVLSCQSPFQTWRSLSDRWLGYIGCFLTFFPFPSRFQCFDPASERDSSLFALLRSSQSVTQYVFSPHKHCAFRTTAPNESESSCELMGCP